MIKLQDTNLNIFFATQVELRVILFNLCWTDHPFTSRKELSLVAITLKTTTVDAQIKIGRPTPPCYTNRSMS